MLLVKIKWTRFYILIFIPFTNSKYSWTSLHSKIFTRSAWRHGSNCCGAFTIKTVVKMNSGCVKELPVKMALSLAFSMCLIFFGIQVRDEVVRYFRKLTTITQTIQTPIEGVLHLPSISVCVMPAFKVISCYLICLLSLLDNVID